MRPLVSAHWERLSTLIQRVSCVCLGLPVTRRLTILSRSSSICRREKEYILRWRQRWYNPRCDCQWRGHSLFPLVATMQGCRMSLLQKESCAGMMFLMDIWKKDLGPIWVQSSGSKSSLEDQERAVSTVEI